MYNINIKVPVTTDIPCTKAFSAIYTNDIIKINVLEDHDTNPYTTEELIKKLDLTQKVSYVNAPLDAYFVAFRPSINKMVENAYPMYNKMYPDKQDLLSILYLTIVELYNKNYYLHKRLIYRSFTNRLNMEIRHQKHFTDMQSLDTPISEEEDGPLTLLDTLVDADESYIAYCLSHYTQEDYKKDLFEKVKQRMLEDMSPLAFERILIQLKTRTIDSTTSRRLEKYRKEFACDNSCSTSTTTPSKEQ